MKKILISMLTLIFIISLTVSVNAATTGSISLALSKDTIKAGDEFLVVVTATDTNNINTIEYTTISIKDEGGNTTSDITVKSVDAVSSSWYRETEGQSTYFVYSGEQTQTQEVFKITFTVGENVKEGTYTISVEGLKVYSLNTDDDTTDVGTKTISVNAIVDDTTAGNPDDNTQTQEPENTTQEPENTTQAPSNTNNSGNKSTGNSSTSKKNTTNKTTKLPQTGVESVSVIAIIALGAMGIASYISYRKYKNI